ncbi:MAG: DUF2520 domain-containing protein [Acidaminococcales bacterium]|nr:DUF2520 domain-containing protein [Acidaminococcales bacterium]
MNKTIGVIGAGRLGCALAARLKEKGCAVAGVTCASFDECRRAAKTAGVRPFADNGALAAVSDILFITVPDGMIVDTAADLLAKGVKDGALMLHCSGALSAFALPPDRRVLRGGFHPLQSFADKDAGFENIHIAVGGDPQALPLMLELCAVLGAKAMSVPDAARPLYHAAACMASNHLVALLAAAEDLFSRWADSPAEARAAFWPLVEGTLRNFRILGPEKALTGPIARGDSQTVGSHLQALPPEYTDFYKKLSRQTLCLARKSGNLTAEKIKELDAMLR